MENPVKTTHKLRTAQVRSVPPIVRLVHIPNATDADGEPRVALEVPPGPGTLSRRPVLLMFATMAAALASKQSMEGQR
jgi:hypothetical protein